MEIFPGGSGLSPSKEVNKGDIIIKIIFKLIETILQYNDGANQRKKNIFISSNTMCDELGKKA